MARSPSEAGEVELYRTSLPYKIMCKGLHAMGKRHLVFLLMRKVTVANTSL
jgi:hypothetical protein